MEPACTLKLNLYKRKVRELCIYLVCWSTFKNVQSFLHPDMLMHLTWALVLLINPDWLPEIRQPLCIALACSYKHLSIDVKNIIVFMLNTVHNKPLGLKNRVLLQLKGSRSWEGHCLPSPRCSLPVRHKGFWVSHLLLQFCLWQRSWWLLWLVCELQWSGEGCTKHFVGFAVGKVIMGKIW